MRVRVAALVVVLLVVPAVIAGLVSARPGPVAGRAVVVDPCLVVYDADAVPTGEFAAPPELDPTVCLAATTTTTTVPDTTTTTTEPSTTTTEATTTTSSTPTTTTVPPSGDYIETFSSAASLDGWEIEVHHRTDHDGGQPAGSWLGDHDANCGAPETKRLLDASDRPGSVYWCPNAGGHFMTSMGEVDGYSIVSVSPPQVFPTVSKVCWDQNVSASLGTRQWVEVLVVPATVIDTPHDSGHRITFNNPFTFEVDGTVRPHVEGVFDMGVAPIAGDTTMMLNGEVVGRFDNPSDPEGRDSVAVRRTHCLTELSGDRVEFRVQTDGADWVGVAEGAQLPDASRVILSTHHYTPTKDQGFDVTTTWHWDNLTVEG
jgi:hypothetical protein